METKTIIWISLLFVWLILFAMNLKAYFFLRTIHKIHQYTGLPMKSLNILVPNFYTAINMVSALRWILVIVLFFYSWIAAILCLIIEYVLPIFLPEEDDYKNIEIMRNELKNKGCFNSLDDLLKEIMEKL